MATTMTPMTITKRAIADCLSSKTTPTGIDAQREGTLRQ
jgi:hypothetical protein